MSRSRLFPLALALLLLCAAQPAAGQGTTGTTSTGASGSTGTTGTSGSTGTTGTTGSTVQAIDATQPLGSSTRRLFGLAPTGPGAAQESYNLGVNAYNGGDNARAILMFEKVVATTPTCADAYQLTGMAYLRSGKSQQGLVPVTNAIQLKSYGSQCLTWNAGNTSCATFDYQTSQYLQTAQGVGRSDLSGAYIARGSLYLELDDTTNAMTDFTTAHTLDPTSAIPFNYHGVALAMSGNLTGAMTDFTRAVEIMPNYAEAYCNRALAYLQYFGIGTPGTTGSSSSSSSGSSGSSSQGSSTQSIMANAYESIGSTMDIEDAYRDLSLALEMEPEMVQAYYGLALYYNYKRNYDAAINALNTAVALKPNYAAAYKLRGDSWTLEAQRASDNGDTMRATDAMAFANQSYATACDYDQAYCSSTTTTSSSSSSQ